MRLNKKGFVASGVLYSLLLLFLALILGLLALLANRKMILDKLKKDIKNDIIQVNTYDYYENGTIIYYNPVTGKICNDYTEDNSNTGVKEGCLKWYIFNDNIGNANVNMILDHNTTATIEWISDTDYGSSAKNDKGPITVNNQLKSDTENWNKNLNTRLITANEVATIVGNIDWNSENIESTPFYFHDLSNEVTTGRGDVCASSGCKYSWLYDRTRNNCTTYGCLNNSLETNIYGYWTSSLVAGETTSAWYINYYGHFDNHNVVNASKYYGVRPVITVSKKQTIQKPVIVSKKVLVDSGNTTLSVTYDVDDMENVTKFECISSNNIKTNSSNNTCNFPLTDEKVSMCITNKYGTNCSEPESLITYLIKNGNTLVDFSTANADGIDTATLTKNSNHLNMVVNVSLKGRLGIYTTNPIDFSLYKSVYVDSSSTIKGSSSNAVNPGYGLYLMDYPDVINSQNRITYGFYHIYNGKSVTSVDESFEREINFINIPDNMNDMYFTIRRNNSGNYLVSVNIYNVFMLKK